MLVFGCPVCLSRRKLAAGLTAWLAAKPAGAQVAPPDPYEGAGGQSFLLNGKPIPRAMVFRVLPVTLPLPWVRVTSLYGLRNDPIYGYNQFHPGVDFGSPIGPPVYSTSYGRVKKAGWAGDYGNLVEVEHGLGFSTRYGHLSKIRVTEGSMIDRNTVVGDVGNTGYVTGPHLHYEIRWKDRPINPIDFIVSAYKLYHHLDEPAQAPPEFQAQIQNNTPPPTSGVNQKALGDQSDQPTTGPSAQK